MSKQNRLLMTNKTDYMTQEDHAAYDQELEKIDLKNMVEQIAADYDGLDSEAYNPIKDVLNQLLMFGEGEGVLVKTAIKQLWEVNQKYKEDN